MNVIKVLIIIFLIFGLGYFIWPVHMMVQGTKNINRNGYEQEVIIPIPGGCWQSCIGGTVKVEKCQSISSVCDGTCYGFVMGTCVQPENDKMDFVSFIQARFGIPL